MSRLSHDPDDEFAVRLAAYDVELAAGLVPSADDASTLREVGPELAVRLDKAQRCLDMLEEVWPRSKPDERAMPATVGRFRILRELGRGGFGIVYLARDEKLGREIALKVQRPEAILSPELRQRFLREAKTAARLRHPNIAAVHEVGEAGLRIWIASEYCEGRSLAEWLRECSGRISPAAAAAFLAPLARALEYSHRQGVLHRDLKPSNVLLEPRDSGGDKAAHELARFTPKLIDFGLAKVVEGEQQETRSGMLVGTPGYMAPEQAGGRASQVGPAADVYSAGVILYELLAGAPPFQGENDLQTLRRIAEDEPLSLRKARPEVPRDLQAICFKCLQKRPPDRYRTAGELAADLDRFLAGQPTVARPVPPTTRLLKWTRRRPALAGLLAVSVVGSLAMIILAIAYIAHLRESNATAERLQREARASAEHSQKQERAANQFLYAARIRLVDQELEHGAIEQAAQVLDAYNPTTPLSDLRGFEWYFLKRRLHGERLSLDGHRGEVYAVVFSPDGRQLASGASDGLIKFWDPVNGQELASIAAHKSCVNNLAYSPDGRQLVSGSCDHTIKLWDTGTHQLLSTLEGHSDYVSCVAISPRDDRLLASAGNGPFVRIWDLPTGEILQSFDTQTQAVQSLAWRADGKSLIIAGAGPHRDQSHTALLTYDVETGRATHDPSGALAVVASKTNEDVFVGLDTMIRHTGERQPVALLHGHADPVDSLALSPREDLLASGGRDSTIRLWDTTTNHCQQILTGHKGRVQALAFSPNAPTLASASFDGTVKLWDYDSTGPGLKSDEFCVTQLADRRRLVALSSDFAYASLLGGNEQVEVYKLDSGTLVGTLPLLAATSGFRFMGDLPILFGLSIESAETIDEWDVANWRLTQSHVRILGADMARLGRRLLAARGSGVSITDIATSAEGQPSAPAKSVDVVSGVASFHFSPDGQTLAVYRGDQAGLILGLSGKDALRTIAPGTLHAISNRGTYLARKLDRASVELIEQHSERVLAVLRHSATVLDAAFSPDNKTLATSCDDGSASLWHIATGQEMIRLRAPEGEAFKVQFSADGRSLAVVSGVAIGEARDLIYPNGDRFDGVMRLRVQITVWSGIDGP